MNKYIGVYSNKGGVGKTTISLFLSDFFSSLKINGKKAKVLVIDFDPQSSCSTALLGLDKVSKIHNTKMTFPNFIQKKFGTDTREVKLEHYIVSRDLNRGIKTQKTKLGQLDVLLSDPDSTVNLEDKMSFENSLQIAKWLKKELFNKYDFIFIDLPGHLSKRNGFSLIGAFVVDYFLIPVEPNRLNINAVPLTLKMLKNIKQWKDSDNSLNLLGFVLNKTDKRMKQYKLHHQELDDFAKSAECKIYDNVLPLTPQLANATDDSLDFFTLSDRYDNYYKHIKGLVVEITKDLGFKIK